MEEADEHVWDRFLTDRDRQVFAASGYGRRAGFGQRPTLLVVDANHNFLGDDPDEPLLDAIRRWPNTCGPGAWGAVNRIANLLAAARSRGVPVIYCTGTEPRPDGFDRGRWLDKHGRAGGGGDQAAPGNAIVPPIVPEPPDIVLTKSKPSAFFGTLLAAFLVDLQADSVIVCGATTSGCVRATVVDGFSLNLRMAVVEDGTADRGEASHAMSLFDMDQKYADVVSSSEVLGHLQHVPEGLFDARMPSLAVHRGHAQRASAANPRNGSESVERMLR